MTEIHEVKSVMAAEDSRYYYVGREVSLSQYHKSSFDITDIRRIGDEIHVFVWHNGQETLYDRIPLDEVTYMEGRYGDPLDR